MSDIDAPGEVLPPEFESALKKLKALFAGALGDAKLRSCSAAWSEIKPARTAERKTRILNEKAQQWREDSVKAIREWFSKFADLATAYDEALQGDALQWAKDKVWEMVEKQCGIRRAKCDEAKNSDFISRTTVFWFAVASEGNTDVNLLPLQPWTAPGWLARGDEQRDSLLREHSRHLCVRLNQVINEEIDAAEIRRAISRREVTGQLAERDRKGAANPLAQFKRRLDPLERVRPEEVKALHFGLPNSIDLKIWKRLDPHRNRLTSLKLRKARNKYREQVEAETRQLRFTNRNNANSMVVPSALLQMRLKKADEFSEQQYSIFLDAWTRLGGVESAGFIRTVSFMAIQRSFGPRASALASESQRRFRASGGLGPGLPAETIRKEFEHLKTEWRTKLEIKALEWEAQAPAKALMTASHNSREAGVPGIDEGLPTRSIFHHSADYRAIKFKGTDYVLTPNQSLVVQVLHEALKEEISGASSTTLSDRLGTPASRLRDSFRSGDGPRLWKTLIVKVPRTKDMYKLNLS